MFKRFKKFKKFLKSVGITAIMATIEKFEEIISWREARILNKNIGKLIDGGRFKQSHRLIGQIEGSAGSIMDNIAEGFETNGNKEFIQFLYIAKGSCGELRSHLYRALDRDYIDQTEFDELTNYAMPKTRMCFQNPLELLKLIKHLKL
jgi:four helix bundle protein